MRAGNGRTVLEMLGIERLLKKYTKIIETDWGIGILLSPPRCSNLVPTMVEEVEVFLVVEI
jgi:hypothetical protein